jgi:pimeloyl-ACP methyl ester carboxylesterase
MQKTPAHVASACLETLASADLRASLKNIKAPTAVFHGKHDALTPLAGGEAIQKAIKGATLTVFEESGHAPHLEEPDAFNAALAKLLSE